MGAEHSHHQDESSPNSTGFNVEQREDVTDQNQSEVPASGNVVEKVESEKEQRWETLKVLDTKCEVLKYENNYLRGQVYNLKEKVEMLENANKGEELELKVVCLEMNNFEKRIKQLESQNKNGHSPSPQISKQVSVSTSPPSEAYKSCSKVYKSSVPVGICQDKNSPTKKEKAIKCINTSNQKGIPNAKINQVNTLKYYDKPLPENLFQLCTVTRCGLCCKSLASQLLASGHYWSRQHFKVLEAKLEMHYKDTPELKPNFKSSLTYSRPLPEAIISKCSKEKCGLCNVNFPGSCNKLAKDHYYGNEHNTEILRFIQKNTDHWQEGLVNLSKGRSTSQKAASPKSKSSPKPVSAPASWLPILSQSVPAEIRAKFKQDSCELCQVVGFTGEPVARAHFKGKKHTLNVENLLKPEDTTEKLLELSEEFLDYDDEVMLSDDTKEVITVSESSIVPGSGAPDPVFIGMDSSKEGKVIVECVIIINQEGGVMSIFADDIGSLSKALHDLLHLLDYPQLAPQLKMIVPCGLPVKKKDFVMQNVTMYGTRLPLSKEKVVGFDGGVLEMISGVEQCLLLMEKNKEFCSYGGPGSRYDYSDHDGQTAALSGDWHDGHADVPVQDDVECSSCQAVGLQHFSGAQLRRGEARRCQSCVST